MKDVNNIFDDNNVMTDFSTIKKLFHISESNGFENKEIETIKNIFGNLPQVFVDYYAELGKIQNLNQTQDLLITPERFQYYQHNDFLIFYSENQRACVWGINKQDLLNANPPVYISYDQKTWLLETETLLEFFTAMAFLQAAFALQFSSESFKELKQTEIDFIVENYKNKNVAFKQWCEGIKFYGNYSDDVIIIMSNNQLFYSANTEEHFCEMDENLSKLGIEM